MIFLSVLVPVTVSFDLKYTESVGIGAEHMRNYRYCNVSSPAITSPNEMITSMNGDTAPTNYQGLYFGFMVVHYLPRGISKFFPLLRALRIDKCGFKSIQAADLEGLSDLQFLWIRNNDIEELSSDLLKFTPKLNQLNFARNKISHVGKNLLDRTFKIIDFTGNKCIDSKVGEFVVDFMEELQEKCPDPIERLESLKPSSLQREVTTSEDIAELKSQNSDLALENSELKAQIDRLTKKLQLLR